jgi:DNA-binding beta-propeller fold protein YncE
MRAGVIARIACVLVWAAASALLWLPPLAGREANADGGAPNLVYLAGTPAGVSAVDVLGRRVSRTFALASPPQSLLVSLDGSRLYATQPGPQRVVGIDTRTGALRCTSPLLGGHPSLLAQTPLADQLFASGGGWTEVAALDPGTCAVTHHYRVGEPVTGLATSFLSGAFPGTAGTYQLWVASAHHLSAFDTASGQLLGSYPVPAGPLRITIPPNSTTLYLTTAQATVVAFDALHKRLSGPLLAGGTIGAMDFDDSTGEVYVPDAAHRQIDVLAPLGEGLRREPNEPIRRLPLPAPPLAVAIASGGQLGFAALQDGRLAVLDLLAHRVVATVAVGGHPGFLVSGPYPPPVSTPAGERDAGGPPPLFPLALALALAAALLLLALLLWRRRGQRGRW